MVSNVAGTLFELINKSLKNYGALVYFWKLILKRFCVISENPRWDSQAHAHSHAELQ